MLVITPGAIGEARVGMSKDEALATGFFDTDIKAPAEGCDDVPLQWKCAFDDVDVLTSQDGTITSLGARAPGVATVEGIGVGSTYGDFTATYGDDLTPPIEAGFGQTGVLLEDADAWIGFLFDTEFDGTEGMAPDEQISFIEVTRGSAPELDAERLLTAETPRAVAPQLSATALSASGSVNAPA